MYYKKFLAVVVAAMLVPFAASSAASAGTRHEMQVASSGIVNGVIADQYGQRGAQFGAGNMPSYSLPIKITNAPEGTVSYAIVIDDHDAIPVCGFTWIHWVVANLERNELMDNESLTAKDFVQGANSWYGAIGGLDPVAASAYGGMAPPDKPHLYTIRVFALDTKLPLEKGFFLNQLYSAMDGHILAEATLKGSYTNKLK